MQSDSPRQAGRRQARGRDATRPTDIPARGWLDIVKRTQKEVKTDNVTLIAAGVAFYSMLAIFPALIAVVTIYGLVAEPADVQRQVGSFAENMPPGAGDLLTDQLQRIVETRQTSLSIALAISLAAALWSASAGIQALIKGLNIAYDAQETRGFVKLRGLALLLTIGGIVVVLGALALIAVLPAVLRNLGLGRAGELAISIGRWPALIVLVAVALAILYRLGPDRATPRLRWVSWGALAAVVLWVAVSAGFSYYVSNFGRYGQTYGSLGAVIVLLLWLWLSALAALIGAELDAEIERQTARDTTTGPERPSGERDATVADTLGESPPGTIDTPSGRGRQ
jgi:membrane protein